MAQSTCRTPDCGGVTGVPGTARGLCSKCYNRWRRHGDVTTVKILFGDDEARFWSKVNKSGSIPEHCPELGSCWVWTTGLNHDGYGAFSCREDGRTINLGAHRWLLGHLRGEPLGPNEEACHHCDNPPCVNPAHLYVGSHAENMADHYGRNRNWQAKVTHCPQGHPYDDANTRITREGRRRCRECFRQADHRRQRNKTECKHGHPLQGDNLLIAKNGARKCRACEDVRIAASRAATARRKAN